MVVWFAIACRQCRVRGLRLRRSLPW